MTVPAGISNGILILCGSHWNANQVTFSAPAGAGVASFKKLHDDYININNVYAKIHVVIYSVSLVSGGNIVVESNYNETIVGKTMILQYV